MRAWRRFARCRVPQKNNRTMGSCAMASEMPAKWGSLPMACTAAIAMNAVNGAAKKQANSSKGYEAGADHAIRHAW